MSSKHPVVAVTGSSGAGTTTVKRAFEHIFERQVRAFGKPEDLLIGISTSGASPNVIRAIEAATGVVTNPIERAWHGIVDYDDLEQQNIALQEQVDRLIGTQAAAEAAASAAAIAASKSTTRVLGT